MSSITGPLYNNNMDDEEAPSNTTPSLPDEATEQTPLNHANNEPTTTTTTTHASPTQGPHVFLALACLACLLQDANDVPVVSFWLPLFLLAFGVTTLKQRKRPMIWWGWILLVLLRALPAMDYFYYNTSRIVAYLTALGVIALLYIFVWGAVLAQVVVWRTTNDAAAWHTLVFPILLTALFQILLRFSPIGGVGNFVMGLAVVPGLRQLASLLGETGLVFYQAWTASLAVRCGLVGQVTRQKVHVKVWAAFTILILLYGWIREDVGRGFYLQDIDHWPLAQAPLLQVACLTRPADSNRQVLIDRTQERMVAGDDLILWSESAVHQPITWNDFDWSLATNPGTVVAATFFQNATQTKTSYNSVALWNAQGLISEYSKNRPVPVVEYNISRGTQLPSPTAVQFTPTDASSRNQTRIPLTRNIATAICFDLDFDYLSRRNAHQADVMIGPSWYWASIGNIMWHHNTFRALENGFHLLKCSERGITGQVDPYGRVVTALPSLQNQVYFFQVPLSKGVKTMYASLGFVFGWICVGLAPMVLVYVGCYSKK